MKRMGGWLSSKAPAHASRSMTALDEPHALQEAMASAAYIMNDEVERAETELSKGTSPFHKLGRATTLFLRATLGFEKEIMEQASARLSEAEDSASEHHRRAVRDPSTAHHSLIYPVGAEYALCHAESQLMSAVVAVLNESLTESLRGFYKLRKAFTTLHEISEAEKNYLRAQGKLNTQSSTSVAASTVSKEDSESSGVMTPEDEDLEFVDAEEEKEPVTTSEYEGHLDHDFEKLDIRDAGGLSAAPNGGSTTKPAGAAMNSEGAAKQADHDVDFRTVTSDPIDLFIHTGVSLCFGLLQLMLSMIPPAFGRLLSLFSFRGDREAGLRMLWNATRFKQNINGAMAGLITLGFHNGAIAFCDILSSDAMPEQRLKTLLREMRELYPKSKLWLLEEGRMLSADRRLQDAVTLVAKSPVSPLRQVEALGVFERGLNSMFMGSFEQCAEAFIKCIGLNNWSHGLYYYIAGACNVELYRDTKLSDPKKAQQYAAKAEEYLHMVPAHTGKKKFMGRQLPFDVFVNRKITKWDHRAKLWDCSFVEAVGVSPILEMDYFWSGFKRMNDVELQKCLDRLDWSQNLSRNPLWAREAEDEKALLAVMKGVSLRFLNRVPEAKAMLTDNVISHDLTTLKACDHPDTWPLPVAHYELAVCLWQQAGRDNGDKSILKQCSDELYKVEKWESYDLETRIGLKITTARETLRKCGVTPT